MSKIYTKTGDGGTTSLIGGQRVSKCCERLESYGMTDELNSHIGVLLAYTEDESDRRFLLQAQSDLFRIGAWLATPDTNSPSKIRGGQGALNPVPVSSADPLNASCSASPPRRGNIGVRLMVAFARVPVDVNVNAIEHEIDRLNGLVAPQKSFILPGGSLGAAYAHVCRTVCRRTERAILRLQESGAYVDDTLKAYINRLSDYFFVLARKMNADKGVADIPWGV